MSNLAGEIHIGPWVRWTIGPLAALSALIFPLLHAEATGSRLLVAVFAVLIEMLFVCGTLLMLSPTRFAWAGRVIGALIAVAYVLYFVDMFVEKPTSLWPPSERSATTGFNAVLGFLVFGHPGLKYALLGRFSWRRAETPEPSRIGP